MKKKYCAPLIKEVLFKAEEAVSTCITDGQGNVIYRNVTPERDHYSTGDLWIHGEHKLFPPRNRSVWYHGRWIGLEVLYDEETDYLIINDNNAS